MWPAMAVSSSPSNGMVTLAIMAGKARRRMFLFIPMAACSFALQSYKEFHTQRWVANLFSIIFMHTKA